MKLVGTIDSMNTVIQYITTHRTNKEYVDHLLRQKAGNQGTASTADFPS